MGSGLLICFIAVVILIWSPSPGLSAAARINLALGGTAYQSSTTSSLFVAEHAIDGNSGTNVNKGSCTRTLGEVKPWWRLQLSAVYRVSEIKIVNRSNYRYLLDNTEIRIGNSLENNGNNNPRCAVIHDHPYSLTQTVQCRGMEGMYINLYQPCPKLGILTFCEVSVYGELAPPLLSISIQQLGLNVTLVGKRLCWSDALFYCRDFHWDLLTIRGPEDQEMIDELVAGAPFPLTSLLWVGLRRSILGSSWFWMSGDPIDFTQWGASSHHSSPCGGVSSMEPSTWRQSFCEEQLNFICLTGPTDDANKVHFYSSKRETEICA